MANDTFQESFALSFSKWPPDASGLSGLGFDEVKTGKSLILARKNLATDLSGNPRHFIELRLSKGNCTINYTCPKGQDTSLARLRAMLVAARALSILPPSKIFLPSFCGPLLAVLEHSEKCATLPYDLLSKRFGDLQDQNEELKGKNHQLSKSLEKVSASCLALEQKMLASQKRLSQLQGMPDEALRELLLEHLSARRGVFDSSAFCATHQISHARAQEGLELLLASGAIKKLGRSFSVQPMQGREFSISSPHHALSSWLGKRKA